MGITNVLESHSQPRSNEELCQQLTEQKKEDEDEDRGTTEMQTKDLTDILSAIYMAAEKLCGINPDWERSSTVQRGITATLHTYYEILRKRRKNQTVDIIFFLYVFWTMAWAFFSKIKSDLINIFFQLSV